MHLFHIAQCSIQNRNVHISVLNGALWDMEQVHSGIFIFLFWMEHYGIWSRCILGFVHFHSEWSIVGYGTSEFWDLYISVLNGALWDIEQVHSGMCETGQYLTTMKHNKVQNLFMKLGMHCNSNKVWICKITCREIHFTQSIYLGTYQTIFPDTTSQYHLAHTKHYVENDESQHLPQ